MTGPVPVRAEPADAAGVAALVAEAFHPLDVAAWLVPDPDERMRVLNANFLMFVQHALSYGEVWSTPDPTTRDRAGAAVWFPQDTEPAPDIADYDDRLARACGPHLDRFRALDAAFARHHPHQPHHYLAFLAVAAGRQSAGHGSALLDHHHARLDRAGIPAYLEASSQRSRGLYLRHGYTERGPAFTLPGGPPMWPMWRAPQPAGGGP